MEFVWLMTTAIIFISFSDNGNVKGNDIEILVTQKLQEMTDFKESFQKDIEGYILSHLNNDNLTKLTRMVQGLANEKVYRINIRKKIEDMEKAYGQKLEDLATTIENIDSQIENRILAITNATEVSFGSKLEETVSSIEQKFTVSMSRLNQTLGKLYEQFNQWRVPKQVNGGWTAWGSWSKCSSTCGKGTKNRVRTCSDPAPSDGGDYCDGVGMEYNECQISPCKALPYCDNGWKEYQGSCYFFAHKNQESMSWRAAKEFCDRSDSHLLRLDDQMEFEFITNVLWELFSKQIEEGIRPEPVYWTGGNDISNEGQWVWSPGDENMIFTIWSQGEPNNENRAEDCVILNYFTEFKMNDINCWEKIKFICEKLVLR
ncbi:hypothetical protein ACJMK2_038777 [Sinanodonta woodiana]|uniref:C-type lectin domain-containing protein n=1 Tax=Sinanodonta woodiana TaxID=1069815 RepID=A0ABD3WDB1_SINWO